jgi:DNA processing protein
MDFSEWRILLTPGLTVGGHRRLLESFGDPGSVFSADVDVLSNIIGKSLANYLIEKSEEETERILSLRERREFTIIHYLSDAYPTQLLNFDDSPVVLYLRGNLEVLKEEMIAVVGTRRASPYGVREARRFAKFFAEAGITVLSGGARGIDREAHESALEAGGNTVAVLGSGLLRPYPPEHGKLYSKITKKGLLISEFNPFTPPYPWNFPRRNRIVSGLSRALLVIEAPKNSGAMITARWASTQGREVFVIPGDVDRKTFEGNHTLIRNGCILVTSPEELLIDLGYMVPQKTGKEELSQDEQLILSLFTKGALTVDEIMEKSKMETNKVLSTLLLLEMKGKIRCLLGNKYILL